jgi:hypothetical protein
MILLKKKLFIVLGQGLVTVWVISDPSTSLQVV